MVEDPVSCLDPVKADVTGGKELRLQAPFVHRANSATSSHSSQVRELRHTSKKDLRVVSNRTHAVDTGDTGCKPRPDLTNRSRCEASPLQDESNEIMIALDDLLQKTAPFLLLHLDQPVIKRIQDLNAQRSGRKTRPPSVSEKLHHVQLLPSSLSHQTAAQRPPALSSLHRIFTSASSLLLESLYCTRLALTFIETLPKPAFSVHDTNVPSHPSPPSSSPSPVTSPFDTDIPSLLPAPTSVPPKPANTLGIPAKARSMLGLDPRPSRSRIKSHRSPPPSPEFTTSPSRTTLPLMSPLAEFEAEEDDKDNLRKKRERTEHDRMIAWKERIDRVKPLLEAELKTIWDLVLSPPEETETEDHGFASEKTAYSNPDRVQDAEGGMACNSQTPNGSHNAGTGRVGWPRSTEDVVGCWRSKEADAVYWGTRHAGQKVQRQSQSFDYDDYDHGYDYPCLGLEQKCPPAPFDSLERALRSVVYLSDEGDDDVGTE